MVERPCLACSQPFEVPYPSSKRRYCSAVCSGKSDPGTRVLVKCEDCGQDIEREPYLVKQYSRKGWANYCSTECRDAAKRRRKGSRAAEWASVECAECGTMVEVPPWKVRMGGAIYCSLTCSAKRRKRRFEDGPLRGQKQIGRPPGDEGRYISHYGYVEVYVAPEDRPPDQPKKAYHKEHRVVMAQELGRWPDSHETVHHINGDKTDNHPENLQLRSGRHGKGGVLRCRACGSHDIEHVDL